MSEFTFTDFILAILVLIGACIGGYWSYLGSQNAIKNQLKNEQKTVAKVIDIDLKTIYESDYFFEYYSNQKTNPKENIETKFEDIKLPMKLYEDKTLLYFVFSHDIAKLEYNHSSEIYEFYNDLFKADKYWNFVLENTLSKRQLCIENQILYDATLERYNDMNALIIKCGDNIQKIRTELKEVYGL